MKRRNFLKTSALLAGSATLPSFAWSAQSSDGPLGYPLTHRVTDAKAPAVYFVPAVDGAALVRLYDALGQKRIGKVGIKMTFETLFRGGDNIFQICFNDLLSWHKIPMSFSIN